MTKSLHTFTKSQLYWINEKDKRINSLCIVYQKSLVYLSTTPKLVPLNCHGILDVWNDFFIWVILLQICFCWMGPIIGVMVMLISWSILWYSRGRLSIYDCLQNVPITERNTSVLMYVICNWENVYGTERQNKPIFLHMTLKKRVVYDDKNPESRLDWFTSDKI